MISVAQQRREIYQKERNPFALPCVKVDKGLIPLTTRMGDLSQLRKWRMIYHIEKTKEKVAFSALSSINLQLGGGNEKEKRPSFLVTELQGKLSKVSYGDNED